MRQRISDVMPALGMASQFKLRLVIDTNALFQAVRGRMLDGSCFLEKIIGNPTLELCAPPKLEEEIMAKITLKFPAEKRTKHLNVAECQSMATAFLKQIHVRDDIDLESLEYAHSRLGERDADDVPFFALSLSCASHGAITNDKDLQDLDELPTWKLRDAGEMLMIANRGTLSLYLTHDVLPLLFQGLLEAVCALWVGFVGAAKAVGCLVGSGIKKGYEIVSDWPPLVQILSLAVAITVEVKCQPLQKLGKQILEFLKALCAVLKPVLEILASILGLSVTTFMDLMYCSIEAVREIESLPVTKMQNTPPMLMV
jgi:predicted nucleic acid-binding protein